LGAIFSAGFLVLGSWFSLLAQAFEQAFERDRERAIGGPSRARSAG
jgi:hypothetical protein